MCVTCVTVGSAGLGRRGLPSLHCPQLPAAVQRATEAVQLGQ